jgi:SAM-dependent methyltransferase
VPPAVHPVAGLGFGSAAEAYERGRPSWAPEAVRLLEDELALGPGRVVADVAAGTGKLTRLLRPSGATVVAVEPIPEMAGVLRRVVPGVPVGLGLAERLPLRDGSVDAVVVAEAFHWFPVDETLAEVRRVLRPGGGLALLWNRAGSEPAPWQAQLGVLLAGMRDPSVPFSGSHATRDWAAEVAAAGGFTPVAPATFPHEQVAEPGEVVAGALSTSWVAIRPEDERRRFAEEVRSMLAGHGSPLAVPWRTEVHWCHVA